MDEPITVKEREDSGDEYDPYPNTVERVGNEGTIIQIGPSAHQTCTVRRGDPYWSDPYYYRY